MSAAAREDAIKRAREGQGKEYVTGFSRYFAVDQYEQAASGQENYVGFWLTKINVPYLAIAAEKDQLIPIDRVRAAVEKVPGPHQLIVVPGITHFDMYSKEPFEISSNSAADWFVKHLNAPEAADGADPVEPARRNTPQPTSAPATGQRPGASQGSTGN